MGNLPLHTKIPKNKKAKHLVLINYCGSTGKVKQAIETALIIENLYPKTFFYRLEKDEGYSGRLEVNIFSMYDLRTIASQWV